MHHWKPGPITLGSVSQKYSIRFTREHPGSKGPRTITVKVPKKNFHMNGNSAELKDIKRLANAILKLLHKS